MNIKTKFEEGQAVKFANGKDDKVYNIGGHYVGGGKILVYLVDEMARDCGRTCEKELEEINFNYGGEDESGAEDAGAKEAKPKAKKSRAKRKPAEPEEQEPTIESEGDEAGEVEDHHVGGDAETEEDTEEKEISDWDLNEI